MQMTRRERFWIALIWAGLIATVPLVYAAAPPEARCGAWEPSSVGWPIRWVRAQGLAQNGWRL